MSTLRVARLTPAWSPRSLYGLVGWWRQGDVVSSAERVSQWNDSSGQGRHLLQATGANQPLLIPDLGENYLWCPGVNANANEATHASTAALRVTTAGIGVAVRVRLTDWTPASSNMLLAKASSAATKAYSFQVIASGKLQFTYTTDGSTGVTASSSVAPTVSDSQTIWVGVWWDNPNSLCYYYTAPDSPTVPTSWSALGTPQALAAASVFSDTSVVAVGRQSGVGNTNVTGKIFRALLYTGTSADNTPTSATTPLLDFNPALGTDGQASLNDAVDGGAWAIPGASPVTTAAYLAQAGRQWVVGDSTAYYMQASYTQDMPLTRFALYRPTVWGSGNTLIGGVTNTMSVQDVTGTPQIRLLNATGGTSTVSSALGTTHALVAVFNGASSIIQVDTTQATGTVNAGTSGGMTILANNTGAAGFKGAQIAEIIEYSRALSQSEINQVLRYLSQRGNLGLAL